MSWWAVDVRSDPALRDAVAAWLVTQTGQAVEERSDGMLVGFAGDAAGAEGLCGRIRHQFEPGVTATLRELGDVDWTTRWRDGIAARRLGRLTLVPSWLPVPEDAEVVIAIDPETAFGSGEHGSTRATLRLLDALIKPGDLVLDLGSGSGILAIAAARLGARRAIGIEVDDEAMPVAVRNARLNGVSDRVEFLEGDAADLAPLAGPADLIVSNILRVPNVALLPSITRALAPGGIVIFAGMEVSERALFLPELEGAGYQPIRETEDEGWWAVAARRL
jgi:ribosomal protein L11 methyltransferase